MRISSDPVKRAWTLADGSLDFGTPPMAESNYISRTDWVEVDATTDDDIARQIAETPTPHPSLTPHGLTEPKSGTATAYLDRGKDVRARRIGRPPGSGKKERVSLRLDRDILDHFRTGGPGWQTRLNDTLRAITGLPDSCDAHHGHGATAGRR